MSGDHIPNSSIHLNHPNQTIILSQTHKNSSVRVVCRIKPLGEYQQAIEMKVDKQNAEISIQQPRQETTKTFTFNHIFTNQTQQQFVSQLCKPVLKKALIDKLGYLIFSYGVTNSGKTHTILGSPNQPGILPYLVKELSKNGQVFLSAIELYNDQFFSLVNKQRLTPRQMGGFLDFDQCAVLQPIDQENMEQKFKQYISNRTQNETKMNSKSSRSHAIFRIKAGNVIIGVVDLAGSQRTNRVFASIDQTSNINKSLLCLGRCIKALNQNPQSNLPIPYRESKLTKVLIQYFAAKVQVLMIANINQSEKCFHENMKVLDYAVLAKDIRHCTTQNSLKKSQYKFPKSNKVDVFQALYKSAAKSTFAHKSLKSSRSKLNQKLQKSNMKANQTNKKFAKALKAQQLKSYIQKFDSSQQTFDYMLQLMHQKQMESDLHRVQIIKNSKYHSPCPQNTRKNQQTQKKEMKEIGVGRSQQSDELMKRQIYQKMKQELKILLQQQRLAKFEHKQTSIGDSLSKLCNKSDRILKSQQIQATPQKQKIPVSNQSFVIKTSNAIYSSVKKILSEKMQSFKKVLPSFKKTATKHQKLTICNYGQIYESLFTIQNPNNTNNRRSSQFSFYNKIKKLQIGQIQQKKSQNQTIHCNFYATKQSQSQKQTQQTSVETDDDSQYPNLQIHGQHQVVVNNNEARISSANKQKENKQINQIDEVDSQYGQEQKQTKQQKQVEQKQTKYLQKQKRKQKRNAKPKSKAKEAALRVAQMRKYAARLCRQQTRTPLKNRLRNHRNK